MRRACSFIAATLVALLLPAIPAWAPCHAITFEGDPYTVAESAGKVTITVSNNGGQQTSDQMVDYKTINGTAKSGSDYVGKSGTVEFGANAPGELSFDIDIRNDQIHESSEQFTIELSNVRPPSSCVPPPGVSEMTASVTITDNDPKPTPTQTTTPSISPKPKASSPSPTPTPTKTATPIPTPTETPTPTPSPTNTVLAKPSGSRGLSGGAIAGIVAAVVVLGGVGAFFVRRRFLT